MGVSLDQAFQESLSVLIQRTRGNQTEKRTQNVPVWHKAPASQPSLAGDKRCPDSLVAKADQTWCNQSSPGRASIRNVVQSQDSRC